MQVRVPIDFMTWGELREVVAATAHYDDGEDVVFDDDQVGDWWLVFEVASDQLAPPKEWFVEFWRDHRRRQAAKAEQATSVEPKEPSATPMPKPTA